MLRMLRLRPRGQSRLRAEEGSRDAGRAPRAGCGRSRLASVTVIGSVTTARDHARPEHEGGAGGRRGRGQQRPPALQHDQDHQRADICKPVGGTTASGAVAGARAGHGTDRSWRLYGCGQADGDRARGRLDRHRRRGHPAGPRRRQVLGRAPAVQRRSASSGSTSINLNSNAHLNANVATNGNLRAQLELVHQLLGRPRSASGAR